MCVGMSGMYKCMYDCVYTFNVYMMWEEDKEEEEEEEEGEREREREREREKLID